MTNNDNLGPHKAELLNALKELPPRWQILDLRKKSIPKVMNLRDIERWVAEYKTHLNELLTDTYRRIAIHADVIVQSTDDERVVALVGRLGNLTSAEIRTERDQAAELETVSDQPGLVGWALKWTFGMVVKVLRRAQIHAVTKQLEDHIRDAA